MKALAVLSLVALAAAAADTAAASPDADSGRQQLLEEVADMMMAFMNGAGASSDPMRAAFHDSSQALLNEKFGAAADDVSQEDVKTHLVATLAKQQSEMLQMTHKALQGMLAGEGDALDASGGRQKRSTKARKQRARRMVQQQMAAAVDSIEQAARTGDGRVRLSPEELASGAPTNDELRAA